MLDVAKHVHGVNVIWRPKPGIVNQYLSNTHDDILQAHIHFEHLAPDPVYANGGAVAKTSCSHFYIKDGASEICCIECLLTSFAGTLRVPGRVRILYRDS